MGSAQVTRGYLGTTTDRLDEDNLDYWIVIGHIAMMDEDNNMVYMLGRYKDLRIRGREEISLATIECCMDQSPAITVKWSCLRIIRMVLRVNSPNPPHL